MLNYENDELIVIKVCPCCAKDGRGRGLLRWTGFNYSSNRDGYNVKCRLCGWSGSDAQCQDYCFPCEVQRVTVLDIDVLQNLWAFALRKDESVEIMVPGSNHWPAPKFEIKAEDCKDRLMSMDTCYMETALRLLVARGCLLPGVYKIVLEARQ